MKKLTSEEKETLDALVEELDKTAWIMDDFCRVSRRHFELYATILPTAQQEIGMKIAPHGKEALLAELELASSEVAHFKALAGEVDEHRTPCVSLI